MPCCNFFRRPRFRGHHPQVNEAPSPSQPSLLSSRENTANPALTAPVSLSQQHSSLHAQDNDQVLPPATSLNPPPIVNEAPSSSPPSRPSSRANNLALTTSVSLSQQQEDPPHQVDDQVPAASSHPSDPPASDLSALIDAALKDYAKQTNIDLPGHPLSARIKEDDTLGTVIGVLSEALDDSGDATHRGNLMKFVNRIVEVVHSISGTVSEAAGVPFPPAKAIFCGIGVLLSAAKDVAATDDALVDLFGLTRNFLDRLKIYTAIPSNPEMTRIIVKTMTELLSILALATKQLKESRLKTYGKILLGDRGVLDAVQKLDKLTREEAQMTGTQILKVTHDLMNYMKMVMDGRSPSINGIQEALVSIERKIVQLADETNREQLQRRLRKWLSPPDPSVNHNLACDAHHKGTASWFIQGHDFEEWKARGSLMWIHGIPGSGKSVLCSMIIEEVQRLRGIELASVAYFYFDFRSDTKQSLRSLLSSLLVQLSAQSSEYRGILSDLHKEYDDGGRQPSDAILAGCLKKMLALRTQGMVYIILDALDECPASGLPSPRDKVVKFIKELVDCGYPSVRICATSRPEAGIRSVLQPLKPRDMSLHSQEGQGQDIEDYIRSVVNSEPDMQKWTAEDRKLAIDTLIKRADGMFRWVHCQLETLRTCLRRDIRSTLMSLPSTLDETYERILEGIPERRREYAQRLFQFLAVSVRPFRVEELADILAFKFEAGVAPKFEEGCREADPEEALLSTCSTMIVIATVDWSRFSYREDGPARVVQFAHFSVQEFITSGRFRINSKRNAAHFHVVPGPAHTLLAHTCLNLLQFDNCIDERVPLATYAAEHWDAHALFEGEPVAIKGAVEALFDVYKPYFARWVKIRDAHRSSTDSEQLFYF